MNPAPASDPTSRPPDDHGSHRGRALVVDAADVRDTHQLATLVGASLPLVECLGALVEQMDKGKQKRILSQVRERVVETREVAGTYWHFR